MSTDDATFQAELTQCLTQKLPSYNQKVCKSLKAT